MSRRVLLFIVSLLVVVIAASSISVLLKEQSNPPSIFWQIGLEHFISDIVYDDSRVFVVDGENVICHNITNGEEICQAV